MVRLATPWQVHAISLKTAMKVRLPHLAASLLMTGAFPVAAVYATDDSTPSSSSITTSVVEASTTTTTLPPVSRSHRRNVKIAFARVVLDEQLAYFYNKNRRLIATIPVSTGVDDQTPLGVFKVFSKSAQTFFTPNPRERMRFMTRFTVGREGGNIGFHGIPYTVTKYGEVPFYTPLGIAPSSHGCIRMRVADAKWVFQNMDIGSTVSVLQSRR